MSHRGRFGTPVSGAHEHPDGRPPGATWTRKTPGGFMEAYCLKCREKREMVNPQPITMKNGKPATTGTCPVCSTKMFKIGKAQTVA